MSRNQVCSGPYGGYGAGAYGPSYGTGANFGVGITPGSSPWGNLAAALAVGAGSILNGGGANINIGVGGNGGYYYGSPNGGYGSPWGYGGLGGSIGLGGGYPYGGGTTPYYNTIPYGQGTYPYGPGGFAGSAQLGGFPGFGGGVGSTYPGYGGTGQIGLLPPGATNGIYNPYAFANAANGYNLIGGTGFGFGGLGGTGGNVGFPGQFNQGFGYGYGYGYDPNSQAAYQNVINAFNDYQSAGQRYQNASRVYSNYQIGGGSIPLNPGINNGFNSAPLAFDGQIQGSAGIQ